MVKRFAQYIADNQLFTKEDKLLIAVSGGMDSVALCHFLRQGDFSFGIAHCNFQLRGEESEGDEHFVENLAISLGVPSHKKRFDTEGVAKADKISTQMAARKLRYDWFENLRQTYDYAYILTAHHASDLIETALFNFAKGTGLRGLTGIKMKNDHLIRPLLWATRPEIEAYIQSENLSYRHDSSNDSDKYARNFIRHQIVPLFQKLNPDFENTTIANLNRLAETQVLFEFLMKIIKHGIVDTVDNRTYISRNGISAYPSPQESSRTVSTVLFEILKDFGFNAAQVAQILDEKTGTTKTGTQFYSPTHVLLIDRKFYILQPLGGFMPTFGGEDWATQKAHDTEGVQNEGIYILESQTSLQIADWCLQFQFSKCNPFEIVDNKNVAQLDFAQLKFPLKLRHWERGDSFKPLGMGGKTQNLSDFFRLNKISEFDKNSIWLLETVDKQICWVVGYRIDERFKITEGSKICYQIEFING